MNEAKVLQDSRYTGSTREIDCIDRHVETVGRLSDNKKLHVGTYSIFRTYIAGSVGKLGGG